MLLLISIIISICLIIADLIILLKYSDHYTISSNIEKNYLKKQLENEINIDLPKKSAIIKIEFDKQKEYVIYSQSKIDKTDVALAVVRHHADIENGSNAVEFVQIDDLVIRKCIIGRQGYVQPVGGYAFRTHIRRTERRNSVFLCLFAIIHFALFRTYAPCIKILFRYCGRFFALLNSKSNAERCRQCRKEKHKQA